MQTIIQDLRYAFRSLIANPGFAGVAVLMLALGIGANSTIFSWVNSVLLDPMPGSARTQELVQFTYLYKGDVMPSFSYPDYQDISRAAKQVSGITGFDDLSVGVVVDRDAERAWAEIVTANFFDVLGAPVALGRGFTPQEETPGAPATVVLSHAYWQRRFNADPRRDRAADQDQLAAVHHDRRRRRRLLRRRVRTCRTTCGCRSARSRS